MKNLSCFPYRDYDLERIAGVQAIFRNITGCFYMPIGKEYFQVIASNQCGWEHVSISHENRCPTYPEMVYIKEMFFHNGEIAFQVHPRKENYINIAQNCLHLWRPSYANPNVPNATSILNKYEFFTQRSVYREGIFDNTKYVAIYNPNWPSWDEVCDIKQKCFGDTEVLQFHVNEKQDLNEKRILLLWEHKNNFQLPPKEFVM